MSLATLIFSHLYSIFYIFSMKFYFLEKFMPKIMPINLEKYASALGNKKTQKLRNVIKLRDDEPSGYYCLDGIFI